jgi:hypothetical protein
LSTNTPPANGLLCCAMSCATKTPAKITASYSVTLTL